MTVHCPRCGEPAELVPITTLTAHEIAGCGCEAELEPIGPDEDYSGPGTP